VRPPDLKGRRIAAAPARHIGSGVCRSGRVLDHAPCRQPSGVCPRTSGTSCSRRHYWPGGGREGDLGAGRAQVDILYDLLEGASGCTPGPGEIRGSVDVVSRPSSSPASCVARPVCRLSKREGMLNTNRLLSVAPIAADRRLQFFGPTGVRSRVTDSGGSAKSRRFPLMSDGRAVHAGAAIWERPGMVRRGFRPARRRDPGHCASAPRGAPAVYVACGAKVATSDHERLFRRNC